MSNRWSLRTHTAQGRDRNRCCDAAFVAEANGWRVLVVCDGVSSRVHSHFGAHLTSRTAGRAGLLSHINNDQAARCGVGVVTIPDPSGGADEFAVHWQARGPAVSGLPCGWAFSEPVRMGLAFHVVGDLSTVRGGFAASDGLSVEAAAMLIVKPVAKSEQVRLRTCGASDDVGVAWGGPLFAQVLRDATAPHIDEEIEQSLAALNLADDTEVQS